MMLLDDGDIDYYDEDEEYCCNTTCDCSETLSTISSIGPAAFLTDSSPAGGGGGGEQGGAFGFLEPYLPHIGSVVSATISPFGECPISPLSFAAAIAGDASEDQEQENQDEEEGVEAYVPVSPTSALDVCLVHVRGDKKRYGETIHSPTRTEDTATATTTATEELTLPPGDSTASGRRIQLQPRSKSIGPESTHAPQHHGHRRCRTSSGPMPPSAQPWSTRARSRASAFGW